MFNKEQIKKKIKKKKQQLDRRINEYGGDILHNEAYRPMFKQTHHLRTSVGKHSVQAARMGLLLCGLLKRRGIKVDEKKVVRIALLHDIGMLERDARYKSNFECGRLHPTNSAKEASRIWPEIDAESEDAIRGHMWPLSLHRPHTREGAVLCMADKLAALKDIIF